MRFEFATATRVVFGPGTLREVGPIAAELGRRALVVTGSTPERVAPLLAALTQQEVSHTTFAVSGEPTTTRVCEGANVAIHEDCDLIVGFGGGSALDAGKAIAALVSNGCEPYEYLEVVGKGKPLTRAPLPYIAIPTTAGTGAEVTRNAVLVSPEHRVKVSLRSALMLPRVALVDPELTYSLPPSVTANTGLDALTQVIEPFVSNRANPLTDAVCREGMLRVGRSLMRAYEHGDDASAREDMAVASLFGGLALANARLGAVHGFAAVIGGMFAAPHGAVCARLLPSVMVVNVKALQERAPGSDTLRRYDEVGRLLTGDDAATARDAATWIQALAETLQVQPLRKYGVARADFPVLVEKARAASSMQGNPISLTSEELHEILDRAL